MPTWVNIDTLQAVQWLTQYRKDVQHVSVCVNMDALQAVQRFTRAQYPDKDTCITCTYISFKT